MNKLHAFGEALKALMTEHGMYIVDQSCGCCGHTYLADGEGNEIASINDNGDEGKYLNDLLRGVK